jgi:Protein of unknown function (DUF3099)
MTAPQPDDDRQGDAGRLGPLGFGSRRRAYFVMMGICLSLFILAWALVARFSILAAVIMSLVALVIPPFAAIVANSGPANRQ